MIGLACSLSLLLMVIAIPGATGGNLSHSFCKYVEKLRSGWGVKAKGYYAKSEWLRLSWAQVHKDNQRLANLRRDGHELMEVRCATRRLHYKQLEPPEYHSTLGYVCTIWHLLGMECLNILFLRFYNTVNFRQFSLTFPFFVGYIETR